MNLGICYVTQMPRFHGRFSPGVVTDAQTVIDLILHAPRSCPQLSIKIWEFDTFPASDGTTKKEGTEDDLLAEFSGELTSGENSQAQPDWRTFTVAQSHIISDNLALATFKLRFPGADTVYEIPIHSEEEEVEGRWFELGFSLHVGGTEKFRTQSPCLFLPPRLQPLAKQRLFLYYDEDFQPIADSATETRHILRHAAIGIADGDPEDPFTPFTVLANGFLDVEGNLIERDIDPDLPEPRRLLTVRARRKLFIYIHDATEPFDLGPSQIPIALCDPIQDDGTILHERPEPSIGFGVRFTDQEIQLETEDGDSVFQYRDLDETTSPPGLLPPFQALPSSPKSPNDA